MILDFSRYSTSTNKIADKELIYIILKQLSQLEDGEQHVIQLMLIIIVLRKIEQRFSFRSWFGLLTRVRLYLLPYLILLLKHSYKAGTMISFSTKINYYCKINCVK